VFPLLKPGLCALYAKFAGKVEELALVYVNLAIERELCWMADWMEHGNGILLYRSLDFSPSTAGVVVGYTDASSSGMGIWFPEDGFACRSVLPMAPPTDTIFYFEALAVCSAIHTVADMDPVPPRLLIYTDNTNTVAMFNTLRAQPAYNAILVSAVNILLQYSVDLRVEHIAGKLNSVADALSRFQDERVLALAPGIDILTFEPPQDALGAAPQ